MASPDRPPSNPITGRLAEEPYGFDFFAAVRLLQSYFPGQPRIGHSWSVAGDPIRLAQSPFLDFAPATLEALQQKNPARPPVLYSRHFGLFGPNGPLPLCYTEFARDRILHHGDATFAAFCNAFHHRLLSFFFRAWADAQKTVDFDRPTDQHWAPFAGSLIGLGMESLLERESVPDRAKLYFAGRLAQQTRNAEGLEAIVQEFFGVRTQLQTFIGRWLDLPAGSVCRLGASAETGSLGATVILGSRFWTCQLHFRLRLGPLNLAEYERLLPTGSSFRRLCDWVRQYSGEHFSWDVQLVLSQNEVPVIQIGRAGRLGWTTWLKSLPFTHDADDLILQGSQ
ncbi:MAG TPA: type VI secretion system baseplate subunit TssG [Verrucomicrobiae bacterium]|nr:type VI secretion system baseplate subunit TssG [Verrucomicrobiae bacterium]